MSVWVRVDDRLLGPMEHSIDVSSGRHSVELRGVFGLRSPSIGIDAPEGGRLLVFARSTSILNSLLGLFVVVPTLIVMVIVKFLTDEDVANSSWLVLPTCCFLAITWVLSAGMLACLRSKAFTLAPQPMGSSFGYLIVAMHNEPDNGPQRSHVYLNGRRCGVMDERIPVPAGVHTIQLRGWLGKSVPIQRSFSEGEEVNLLCETIPAVLCLPAVAMVAIAAVGILLSAFFWSVAPAVVALGLAAAIAVVVTMRSETIRFHAETSLPNHTGRRGRKIPPLKGKRRRKTEPLER